MPVPFLATALTVALATALSPPAAAQAAFVVTTTADTPDALPGDGFCADAAGACSLRAAVSEANARAGADTVDLPAGVYTLALAAPAGDDTNEAGDLDLSGAVVIAGAGADRTVLDGSALRDSSAATRPGDRVMDVQPGATAEVRGLTIRNGGGAFAPMGIPGAGIRNRGALTLRDAAVVGNRASPGTDGGGVWNSGTLLVERSLVADNHAGDAGSSASSGGRGGGIWSGTGATLLVYNSTVSGNTAGDGAGAMNGTFSQPGPGGGIVAPSLTLSNSTVTGNQSGITFRFGGGPAAIAEAGGLFVSNLRTAGSIVAGNTRPFTSGQSDCAVTRLVSLGRNVFGAGEGCQPTGTDVAVSPSTVRTALLAPLADNQGPTRTHALRTGSVARGAGACTDTDGAPVVTDQRGFPRAAPCDAGAFEGDVPVAGEPAAVPGHALALAAPIPNPVRGIAALALAGADGLHVSAALVDVRGRTIRILHEGPFTAGASIQLDTRGLAPGLYGVYVVTAAGSVRRLVTVVR